MWDRGWKTLGIVFRVISNPPRLVGGFNVSTAGGIGAGWRRGIYAPLVVGLEDTFTLVAWGKEIPPVEPAIHIRFGGVVFGCGGRGGIRSKSGLFGCLLRRNRTE